MLGGQLRVESGVERAISGALILSNGYIRGLIILCYMTTIIPARLKNSTPNSPSNMSPPYVAIAPFGLEL
jgi:hypothetical protein